MNGLKELIIRGLTNLIPNSPYWKDGVEFGTKNHMFDGEYWIEMEPARRSYVTVGTDGANFPSQKYDGLTPVRFTAPDLKKVLCQVVIIANNCIIFMDQNK